MAQLKVGNKVPKFEGIDQNGNTVSLDAHRGKKLILYFYPKDDTPGCTAEACNLRDNYSELKKKGFEVIGVSADAKDKHQKFITKYSLPFTLIADTEKNILKAFDAWGEKKLYGKSYEGILRKTFIISEDGTIEHIIEKVDTKNHANQILSVLTK